MKQITLEFTITGEMQMNLRDSREMEMLQWCKKRGMKMESADRIQDFSKLFRVTFYKDKNTYDFIKKFLESEVRHALPYEALMGIPNIKIV